MATLYVQEQGARVVKIQERIGVLRGQEVLLDVPIIKVDRVVVMGRGVQVSTAVIHFLAARLIPLVFTNEEGTRAIAELGAGLSKNVPVRVAQVEVLRTPARALPLIQAIVTGKLANQAALLRTDAVRWGDTGRRALEIMGRLPPQVAAGTNADTVRGYEGVGAAAYWRAWVATYERSWGFKGRGYNPPPDALNALLSFGYTLLLNEVMAAIQQVGLDPYVGFFHTLEAGRPGLALDLEEEFRPLIVDRLVLRLLDGRVFKPEDFGPAPERPGGIYLNAEGRTRYLTAYERLMGERVAYPYSVPTPGVAETWRRCVFLQTQQMARVITGEQGRYAPLIWPLAKEAAR